MSISGTASRGFFGGILAIAIPVAMVFAFVLPTQAQTFTTLYQFTGNGDGANPNAGISAVVSPRAITLYGSTLNGGNLNCNPPLGCGGVYKFVVGGKFTELYSFTGGSKDGASPYAPPIVDAKNKLLVGTTSAGGLGTCFGFGCGVEYEMNFNGKIKFEIPFDGGIAGGMLFSGLKIDPKGNRWGTATFGGDLKCGASSLGCGTIFKIDPITHNVTIEYKFLGKKDGAFPLYSSITADPLWTWGYVTTQKGGDLSCTDGAGEGCGKVARIKVVPPNQYQPEYSFSGPDGEFPEAGVIFKNGIVYGTTALGGNFGKGTVFKFDPKSKTIATLHHFGSGTDGALPIGGVTTDGKGNLYGVTGEGGLNNNGMLYKIDLSTLEEVDLQDFDLTSTGANPTATPTYVPDCGCMAKSKTCKGCLFGTTNQSSPGQGTVWQCILP